MYWFRQSGFSLLEMLAVVMIFLVLGAVSVITWHSFAPGMILNNSAQGLLEMLELSRSKALAEFNEVFVLLVWSEMTYSTVDNAYYHFPANSYVVVDDDGWMGWGTRQYNHMTMFGGVNQQFRDEYDPELNNYTTNHRHNNLMERFELFRGPLRLGRSVSFFVPDAVTPQVRRVVFAYHDPFMYWQSHMTPSNTPIRPEERRTDPARIFIRNHLYRLGDSTKDNLAHRRLVRVDERSTRVIR
ncbi:type II secretion system protein [bacterium]|nr:type II secretion system protein [candidate division CSSED10-310 bacterium]